MHEQEIKNSGNLGKRDAILHYPDVQRDHIALYDFAESALRELVGDVTEKDISDFVEGYEAQVALLDQ